MSDTVFLKSGSRYTTTTKDALNIHDRLPGGTYSVKETSPDGSGDYYLTRIKDFEIPDKLYGNTTRKAERIFSTFQKRPSATGVLLAGTKGSGKTMLAKQVSRLAASQADTIPTVVINDPLCGEAFCEFIQAIEQPLVVIFDEFEKVYECYDDQAAILTLLDGVYSTKKLFIFTSNNKDSINENMLNRPGRIFYSLSFHGIDDQFIREYCEENLDNKSYIPLVVRVAQLFNEFNLDMLRSMVEDMNRYDESPIEVLEYLNADPKSNGSQNHTVKLWIKQKFCSDLGDDYIWNGRAIVDDITIYTNEEAVEFKPRHLKTVTSSGEYVFEKEGGTKMILTPIKEGKFDLKSVLKVDEQEDEAKSATKKWYKKNGKNKSNKRP